jgi:hypothetical protein
MLATRANPQFGTRPFALSVTNPTRGQRIQLSWDEFRYNGTTISRQSLPVRYATMETPSASQQDLQVFQDEAALAG